MEGNQEKSDSYGVPPETWRKVVEAIEDAIPLYDEVNDLISFGKAQESRKFAIQRLELSDGDSILDGGIGPGTTSRLILTSVKPKLLVGLDGSVKQLKTAKANIDILWPSLLQVVRGSFELLPFRDNAFNAVITCYALRDSLHLTKAIGEYARVCAENGRFADVDIGKPENFLKRASSTLYIRYLMPIIAKVTILGRIKGNPWRMIGPTYKSLPTNHALLAQMKSKFQSAELKEFLMGGGIIIIARKLST